MLSMVNGIELWAQEWRDAIFLRYRIEPTYLTLHSEGCGVEFSISCALDCKKGGLLTYHHNKLCGGVVYLVIKSLTPTYLRADPLIIPGCAVWNRRVSLDGSHKYINLPGTVIYSEDNGELLIRKSCAWGTDYILEIRVVIMDALLYVNNTLERD